MSFKESIIVTGASGFIGANLITYLVNKYPQTLFINFDKLTYAGNLENNLDVVAKENYLFIKGDICDENLVQSTFEKYDVKGVYHLAAESHVDNSITGPKAFIETNLVGTFNLLDVARKHWMIKPFEFKKGYENTKFLHVSTDEVYGTLGEEGLFEETTAYAPNSPYSASKAGSDFIVRSYFHTYGMNVVTTNCSNNYGPKQHQEKLIPTIIRKALSLEPIPIYGNGKNVRDWLYVLDHCKGIDIAFHKGVIGETYNIGGRNEKQNITIAHTICAELDKKKPLEGNKKYADLITYVSDRPGHDQRYAIDASKIENDLGWKADENFDSGIIKTIDWYLNKF